MLKTLFSVKLCSFYGVFKFITRICIYRYNVYSNIFSDTLSAAKTAKTNPKNQIIVLGVGDWLDLYELSLIASWPMENNLWIFDSFTDLRAAADNTFVPLICNCKYFNIVFLMISIYIFTSNSYPSRPSSQIRKVADIQMVITSIT